MYKLKQNRTVTKFVYRIFVKKILRPPYFFLPLSMAAAAAAVSFAICHTYTTIYVRIHIYRGYGVRMNVGQMPCVYWIDFVGFSVGILSVTKAHSKWVIRVNLPFHSAKITISFFTFTFVFRGLTWLGTVWLGLVWLFFAQLERECYIIHTDRIY